jgi:hypothetical protein
VLRTRKPTRSTCPLATIVRSIAESSGMVTVDESPNVALSTCSVPMSLEGSKNGSRLVGSESTSVVSPTS